MKTRFWNYIQTMNRTFGKVAGYHENYWAMYRSPHLSQEREAKADISKFFFNLYTRDIRYSSWPQGYMPHETSYVVAYGGGTFGLVYDQTIFRWSTTALPVMFARGRHIEKALVTSRPEQPKTAIIQPCATIFNLGSMGKDYISSPAIRSIFETHNRLLDPGNYAHDFLPEEMVLGRQGQPRRLHAAGGALCDLHVRRLLRSFDPMGARRRNTDRDRTVRAAGSVWL